MRALLFIFTTLLTAAAFAQPAPLSRVLRTIDYEERELGNVEDLPMHWNKVQGPGMPHYVNGKLTSDQHHGGKFSFRMDLNGGSVLYRYDPRLMSVRHGAHYRVETFVRTTVMRHARARLAACLTDIDGRPLAGTWSYSPLFAATDDQAEWQPVAVELTADHPQAAYLLVEIGVLQPEKYRPTSLGERAIFPQDINGTAWFDDLVVWQVPQVFLSTDQPGNLFPRSASPQIRVLVNDRFTDDLAAQLRVCDAEGRCVYQHSGSLENARTLGDGEKEFVLTIPALPAGWYRAQLAMTSQKVPLGTQTLDFVVLADEGTITPPDPRFGLIATKLPFAGWSELPQLLPYLAAARVKLGVWSDQGDVQQVDSAGFDDLLEKLTAIGITPTACLLQPPPSLLAGGTGGWKQLMLMPSQLWRDRLAYMVARHANHLDRWQLGEDGSDAFVTDPAMREIYRTIYKEFTDLVQHPDLAMPWPAWYDLEGQLPATVALSVPATVLPSQLPLYISDLGNRSDHHLSLSLQTLDETAYGRPMRMRDLAQRVIYALSAGAQRIDLPLPFAVSQVNGRWTRQPSEDFLMMRTLLTTLSGAAYVGRVPIAEGVEAFLFERNGEGILALWDRDSGQAKRTLTLNLGKNPRRVDLWGNCTPLLADAQQRQQGQVSFELGPMPFFLLDIDGRMAQLRSSVALDRPLVESSFQAHSRKIRFVNPYRQALAGTLRLRAPSGWLLSPPTFSFTLNPGETFQRDITLEFPYNSFAGSKTIDAEFSLQLEQPVQFTVPIQLRLGLSDVGMQTLALRDGDDVLVQQVISNYGDKPISYSAFAVFPGQARQERLVTDLEPGRSIIKRYRFVKVRWDADAKVRAGVKELNGTRILNDELAVQ